MTDAQEEKTSVPTAQQWIACDKCNKWRTVPGFVDLALFSSWTCEMNEWDAERSNCDAPEIDEKELKKKQAREIKNEKEDKRGKGIGVRTQRNLWAQ